MGTVRAFELGRYIRDYSLSYFFETGTLHGDGVAYALRYPFRKVFSVEIVPEFAQNARVRFAKDRRVEIIEGNSSEALKQHCSRISGNCFFWLDAHYPGQDGNVAWTGDAQREDVVLPLKSELETLAKLRRGHSDVYLLDDLNIYEEGPFQTRGVWEKQLPRSSFGLATYLAEQFGDTHRLWKMYDSEGYALLTPRNYSRRPLVARAANRLWRVSTTVAAKLSSSSRK